MKHSPIINLHMRLCFFAAIMSIIAMATYAAAPWADSFNNYRHWIFPAYLYNLIFGVVYLAALAVVCHVWRKPLNQAIGQACSYLKSSPSLAILSCGILLAIPLGILCGVLYQLLWFSAILPWLILMCIFPLLLAYGRFRNRIFLSTKFVKVILMVIIASLSASISFIIFTEMGWWDGASDIYYELSRTGLAVESHPIDSTKYIWESTLYFICTLPISLLLSWIGNGWHAVQRKFRRAKCRELAEDAKDTIGEII